jgi:hypothetical protein
VRVANTNFELHCVELPSTVRAWLQEALKGHGEQFPRRAHTNPAVHPRTFGFRSLKRKASEVLLLYKSKLLSTADASVLSPRITHLVRLALPPALPILRHPKTRESRVYGPVHLR